MDADVGPEMLVVEVMGDFEGEVVRLWKVRGGFLGRVLVEEGLQGGGWRCGEAGGRVHDGHVWLTRRYVVALSDEVVIFSW